VFRIKRFKKHIFKYVSRETIGIYDLKN